jgi:hypothetical protein
MGAAHEATCEAFIGLAKALPCITREEVRQQRKFANQGHVKILEVPRRGTRSLAVGETYGEEEAR